MTLREALDERARHECTCQDGNAFAFANCMVHGYFAARPPMANEISKRMWFEIDYNAHLGATERS